MRWRDPRRPLALLMGATAVLGLGGGADAHAQETPSGPTGEELFGSYSLEARGQGMRVRYEIEGMLPGGSPVLDLGMPESMARFTSGPIGYGVASLAYPGGVIVNLPSLAEQAGGGSDTPPYPIKEEAFYPTGPTESGAEQPGGTAQRVTTNQLGVDSVASYPATTAPPILDVGSVRSAARTVIEDGKAVSRTRVVANDVVLLGGVITIDSVVTDLVAVHDGNAGSASGGTVANGVKFLGLDASLTDDGFVLKEAPPATGPAEPLGGVLAPVVPPAGQALSPIQKALQDAFGQAEPQLDKALAMAGIHVSIVEPETVDSGTGAASLSSSGLLVGFDYYGRDQEALGQLLDAIPSELKPNLGPLSNPITFFTENHFTAIGIAPASVTSLATPPFPAIDIPVIDVPIADPGVTVPGSTSLGDPGFSTPTPAIAAPGAAGAGSGTDASAALSGALPAALVALALVLSPLFGMGSTKLADNVLAPVSTSCPTGHDRPDIYDPPPERLT
ncbi:MAG: hypothetical protein ACJ739_08225 [Acidimicrobiales bacterium]